MVERKTTPTDPFDNFRKPESVYWKTVEPSLTHIFGEAIPENLKPHLIEWTIVRASGFSREISKEEINNLQRKFSDSHDKLFEDSLFISAITTITNRFPLAD